VPHAYINPDKLVNKHEKWITKKLDEFSVLKKEATDFFSKYELRPVTKQELKQKIHVYAEGYASKMGVKFNKIFVRKQKSKWGSKSSRGNISFNSKLGMMPDRCIEFIVYHELLHFKLRKHNKQFFDEVKKEFPDYDEIQKQLSYFAYKLN
jgi:hypothetical protein